MTKKNKKKKPVLILQKQTFPTKGQKIFQNPVRDNLIFIEKFPPISMTQIRLELMRVHFRGRKYFLAFTSTLF
jgi:hypothetical protein